MEPFDAYHSIAAPSEGLFKDNGSRFIAFAYPSSVLGPCSPVFSLKRRRSTGVTRTTNAPFPRILSIQPFSQDGYDYAVKIKTMNVADHEGLQRQVAYQIRKFNACRKCLKCESLCRTGAISITNDGYLIDPQKCVHCKKCVNAKYLDGGCMMDKYLRTK